MISDGLDRLISSTAWRMTPPQPYGAFHLAFFLVGLAVCIFAAWKLRGLGERGNRRLLLSIGVFLLVCELYKQLFYYYFIGDHSYPWWIFPFQLCSIPMYLCIIAPLLKPGRLQKALYDFMLAFNLMGGFIAFLEPSGLIHEYWTLTLHAFVWHMTLVFIGLYLGFSRRAGGTLKGYKGAALLFVALCGVAFSINLLLCRVSGGSINMFFVGPSVSPLIVFKTISARYGWYVNLPLYVGALCLGAFLFYWPFCLHRKRAKAK